jgi:hypothetical protein
MGMEATESRAARGLTARVRLLSTSDSSQPGNREVVRTEDSMADNWEDSLRNATKEAEHA